MRGQWRTRHGTIGNVKLVQPIKSDNLCVFISIWYKCYKAILFSKWKIFPLSFPTLILFSLSSHYYTLFLLYVCHTIFHIRNEAWVWDDILSFTVTVPEHTYKRKANTLPYTVPSAIYVHRELCYTTVGNRKFSYSKFPIGFSFQLNFQRRVEHIIQAVSSSTQFTVYNLRYNEYICFTTGKRESRCCLVEEIFFQFAWIEWNFKKKRFFNVSPNKAFFFPAKK